MRTSHLRLLLPLAALSAAACGSPQSASGTAPGASPGAAAQSATQPAVQPAPEATRQEGMVVVRDPHTGQLRAPTPAEMQALARSAPATRVAPTQHQLVTGADGRSHVQLGERGMVYSVVTRDGQGRLEQRCVHGAEAAGQAVQHSLSTDRHEGHRHESR